jgi:hypothetical protein
MTVLAVVRPSDWEFPLFVHVLGAMVLVGALILALAYMVPAWRGGGVASIRLGFRSLLYAALPSFVVMRLAGQWIADKEGYTGDEAPSWIDIGFVVSDMGLLLLLIATIVAGVAVRRAGRGGTEPGPGSARVAATLVSLLIVAYLVVTWAMTTKPD